MSIKNFYQTIFRKKRKSVFVSKGSKIFSVIVLIFSILFSSLSGIIFPIREVQAADPGVCYVYREVTTSTDDAQQIGTTMTLNGTTIGGSLDATTDWAAMRFQNITIPKDATVLSAVVSVVPSASTEDEPSVTVYMQNADNPGTFTSGASDISNRTRTTGVAWSSTNLGANGSTYFNSPSLTSDVQTVVNRASWASGNAMVVIIQGGSSSTRDLTIEAQDLGPNTNPPILKITYQSTNCKGHEIISTGNDDAQEAGGTITLNGTTIGGSLDATTEWVGLRFQNITIPQGSTINSATVSVVPSGTGEDEPLVTVYLENADNSAQFSASASDISNRSRTTGVAWSSTNLAATGFSYHDTPDLTSDVQTVVDRASWASGNAMSVLIQGGNTSTRDLTLKSYENTAVIPAILRISFTPPAPITISGTCDAFDKTTDCGDTGTIKVAINGVVADQTQTTVSGTWSISSVPKPPAGASIVVFIDGAADSDRAVAATLYDGDGDIDLVRLYKEHLTIGTDSGSANSGQSLTNANLDDYDTTNDADVFYDILSNGTCETIGSFTGLCVDGSNTSSQERLLILTGNTYTPGGSVQSDNIEVAGSFVPGANTVTVQGSGTPLVITGTLTEADSTFVYSSSGSPTIADVAYNNLTISGTINAVTATATISGTFSVTGAFTPNAGTITLTNTGTPLSISGTFAPTGGAVEYTGNGATVTCASASYYNLGLKPSSSSAQTICTAGSQTLTVVQDLTIGNGTNAGATASANAPTINVTGDFIHASGTFTSTSGTITISDDFNKTGGTFTHNSGTIILNGDALISSNASIGFHNLSLAYSGKAVTSSITGTISLTGTLTLNGGSFDLNTSSTPALNLNCTSNCTPLVFASPTILTLSGSSEGVRFGSNANDITVTIPGGDYGDWSIRAYTNTGQTTDATFQLGGDVVTTSTIMLEATTGLTMTFNTQNYSIDATRLRFGQGSAGRTGVVTVNLGSSTVTLSDSSNPSIDIQTLGGATHILNLDSSNISIAGSLRFILASNGQINVDGGTSTITFNSSATSKTIISHAGVILNNIVVTGSGDWTNTNATLNLTGDLTVSDGTFSGGSQDINIDGDVLINGGVFTAPSTNLTIGGDFTRSSGTFTHNSGEVIFDPSGATATITGSTTFNDFTSTTAGKTLAFNAGDTFTINGVLTITGGSGEGQKINIYSDIQDSQWFINLQGTSAITYANIRDSGCDVSSLDITVSDGTSTSAGNNGVCWVFPEVGITVSGATDGADSITVKVVVNGVLSGQSGTTGSGTWTISNVEVNSGQVIVIFFDGVADTSESTAVAKYDGTGSMTGIVLNTNVLSIGSVDDQSLNLTDLGLYDCDDDEDIMYSSNSGTLLVQGCSNSYNDETLQVESGDTFAPSGNVTSNNLNIAGTYTGGSETVTLSKNFSNSGTFTANTNTVVFNDVNQTSLISGATTFNNLTSTTASKHLTFTAGTTFGVNGLLTLTGSNALPIVVDSSSPNNYWFMNFQGTSDINYVTLRDSGCDAGSNDINMVSSINVANGGNNDSDCWKFVTGNMYGGGGGGNGGGGPVNFGDIEGSGSGSQESGGSLDGGESEEGGGTGEGSGSGGQESGGGPGGGGGDLGIIKKWQWSIFTLRSLNDEVFSYRSSLIFFR